MKNIGKKLLYILPLLFIAGIAGAYTPPTMNMVVQKSSPGGPLTIGETSEAKDGGLSVGTFQARGKAIFSQDIYIGGQINGGHPSDTSSIVTIGSTVKPTEVLVDGAIGAASGQSDTLTSGGGLKNVCAAADGTYILCASPVVVCIINSFTSDKYQVKANSSTPLIFTWSTTGCDSATINSVAVSPVSGGTVSHAPTIGTYTLTASNSNNSATKSFAITETVLVVNSSVTLYPGTTSYIEQSDINGQNKTFYHAYYGKVLFDPMYTVPQGTPTPYLEFCGEASPSSMGCLSGENYPDTTTVQNGQYSVVYTGSCQGPVNHSSGTPNLRYRNPNGTPGSLVGSSIAISGAVNLIATCN